MTKLVTRFTRFRIGYLVTLAAGAAIGLATVGGAAAEPTGKAPLKLVTHHLALAASAFAPDSLGNTLHDYENLMDPTTLSSDMGGRCFVAGLQLPANAILVSVTFYYTPGSVIMSMELNRQNLIKHTFIRLATFNTGSASTYTSTTLKIPAKLATVNYGKFAYSAGVCPSGTATFSGLIITYR